jgi:hypothetical protein
VHDNCWQSLEENIASCNPFTRWYDYKTTFNNDIQCSDPVGTCNYGTCLCDKAAVKCFNRYRNTSYDPDFDNWEGICTETSKAPKVDPDRCPPVWNEREKYSAGSTVSVNGIAYQSLYSVGPGGNPTANTQSSMMLEITATWKKLKPCRRTNEADKF